MEFSHNQYPRWNCLNIVSRDRDVNRILSDSAGAACLNAVAGSIAHVVDADSSWQSKFRSRFLVTLGFALAVTCCTYSFGDETTQPKPKETVELVVLGTAQDAGYPQAGCQKACCRLAWDDPKLRRWVSSIAVVDHQTNQRFIFDCTPDFPAQLHWLETHLSPSPHPNARIDGIFLTHAHIGHYTGLMHLGREAMGTKEVPVYAMPRMKKFLSNNGPWSQLVSLKNIKILDLTANVAIQVNSRISVTPIPVPHRDEFSETVGFVIRGPNKTVLFLPDIDKWSRWDRSIDKLIEQVDLAFLDGTFLSNGELPGRDMSLIPHPFIQESIKQFSVLDETERGKVRFIHLNHTNPAILEGSAAERRILQAGMLVAKQGETIEL